VKYFTAKEVECPCGCSAKLSVETEQDLDALRESYGKPIYIEQGATCLDYSVNKLGRKPTSTHIDKGNGSLALDIKHKTFNTKEDYFWFISCAVKIGFKGIGQGVGNFDIHKKNTRLHIDRRDTNDIVTWVYYSKEDQLATFSKPK